MLTRRIGELESDLAALTKMLAPHDEGARSDAGPVNRDARWHCKKCGYLLAFYDKESDVMRTRYKEHIVFMRAGPGGFIQIICRGCCEVNTEEYSEQADGDASEAK